MASNGVEDRAFGAVMSAQGLRVDAEQHEALLLDEGGAVRFTIRGGEVVSIHGTSGEVYLGTRELESGE